MSKEKNPYQCFPQFVLRTPILPIDFYKELTAGQVISDNVLKEVFLNPLVRESCFLASPEFYFELEKWEQGKLNAEKEKRIGLSLLKYLTRMSSRCTPFGLFAGCGLGNFGKTTSIANTKPTLNKRHTKLDMNYLVALSQHLSKKSGISEKLLFYPNTSYYEIGEQLRYIEYRYVNGKRSHHISEVDNSKYLKILLNAASQGAYLNSLVELLSKSGISRKAAENFVSELVDNQLLISELEPSVSGPEFMEQLESVIGQITGAENEQLFLKKLDEKIKVIDSKLGNNINMYIHLNDYLKANDTSFNIKYLYQTDLELRPIHKTLSSDVAEVVKKGIGFLNKLSPLPEETNLTRFKERFLARYEEREMPLSRVLDVEMGIGYIPTAGNGDINPLIDDLVLPEKKVPYDRVNFQQNCFHRLFEEKLIGCDRIGNQMIVLSDDDLAEFSPNWTDLPDTFCVMIQLILENKEEKIRLVGTSGSSAVNLLGRFCNADSSLNALAQTITDLEQDIKEGVVLAEIVHLPEARVGNILMRPSFRTYEIPYLAKSTKGFDFQIPIQDLFISIRNGKIVLRSQKLNKEIIPRLSNAHNYSNNALPIYQFLCDLQTQNLRKRLCFDFGYLGNTRNFLPRVEYQNLILHEAKWKLKKRDIEELLEKFKNTTALSKAVVEWRKEFDIPKYVLLAEGDNELLINFDNMTSVQTLLAAVKNKSEFILSEFLFGDDEGMVKSDNSHYVNQIIIPYYNADKIRPLTI